VHIGEESPIFQRSFLTLSPGTIYSRSYCPLPSTSRTK